MNKLIIIGNGFDLSHGLKTDYKSFLNWHITRCFHEAFKNKDSDIAYSDKLFDINIQPTFYTGDIVYSGTYDNLISNYLNNKLKINQNNKGYAIGDGSYKNTYQIIVKSNSALFKRLQESNRELLWVDIENIFYNELKLILYNTNAKYSDKIKMISTLNNELDNIKDLLKEYLTEVTQNVRINSEYNDLVQEGINPKAVLDRHHINKIIENDELVNGEIETKNVMFLDFNYTQIIKTGYKSKNIALQYNHIHGTLQDDHNPIIFGYGDEIDESYFEMEKSNINEYLKHIKSFGYFKSRNYSNLVNFINSESFVVYIWGHSCGLSDRTLLNMIFENDFCAGIKIFYRQRSDTSDNFDEITQNISRHFKNKLKMRNRVFNKTFCSPIPQK